MIILIDDIKLRSAEDFIPYINAELKGCDITEPEELSAWLNKVGEETEFLVSDLGEIPEGESSYAARVMKVLRTARDKNPLIKLTIM